MAWREQRARSAGPQPLARAEAGASVATLAHISCRGVTVRLPLYGADARSLKRHLARGAVGGRVDATAGVTVVTALSGLDLELRSGDRLGVIGHNGSGKTTLLRTLSGAYEPDDGQVEVFGRIASLLNVNLGIDPTASGYENIRLRARIAGMSAREVDDKIDDIAEFTGLGPFLAMPVKTYSAGMQARLAFAASTAVEADVVLMDEWMAVGDATFKHLAHDRLLELIDKAGVLVLASHDRELLRLYCNKVMLLEAGRASPVLSVDHLDQLLAAS